MRRALAGGQDRWMGILKGIAGLIKTLAALAFLAIIAVVVVAAVGAGSEKAQDKFLDDIHLRVVMDAMDQYDIAKRHGSMVDRCVQAGLVSAALLQAKEEAKYAEWQPIEKADCKKAGIRK